jgi:hypothetical protein
MGFDLTIPVIERAKTFPVLDHAATVTGIISLSYLRKIWDKMNWLFEGQHGFRPGYSCESQVITVCQDIADSLDNGGRIDAIIIDFSKAFDLVPHDRLLMKIAASGSGLEGSCMGKGIPFGPYTDS